jgi:MFS family permease
MYRKVSCGVMDASSAAALLVPRQGLVLEAAEPPTPRSSQPIEAAPADREGCAKAGEARRSFTQAEGPLRSYRRTVVLAPAGDGRFSARQVVEISVGLPWWSWLLAWPLRMSLGKVLTREQMAWWAPPQRLGRRSAVVVATLAAIVAVQGFLAGLLPETLTYAASQMHTGTFGQGAVFGAVELSSLPALAALALADKRGRRSVVLWATAGSIALSELGCLSPTVAWLAATQVAASALAVAGGIAALVVAVEEVPPGCRAWAAGALGMAAGLGGGVPLALLPLAGTGPGGWRWLYALGFVCLPVVAMSARWLPESRRWESDQCPEQDRPQERGPGARSGTADRSATGTRRPASGRLVLVCTGAVLLAMFAAPASQFQTQFLREQRHYDPLAISVLQQVAGTIGGLGVLVGGRLADTRGRRPVAIACVAGATGAALASYVTHGWLMWGNAIAAQFFGYATAPALGVYSAELFASSRRARSAGLVALASSVGGVSGLVATGALAARIGTLAPALGILATGPTVLVALLLVAYPETAGVALEDLTP